MVVTSRAMRNGKQIHVYKYPWATEIFLIVPQRDNVLGFFCNATSQGDRNKREKNLKTCDKSQNKLVFQQTNRGREYSLMGRWRMAKMHSAGGR